MSKGIHRATLVLAAALASCRTAEPPQPTPQAPVVEEPEPEEAPPPPSTVKVGLLMPSSGPVDLAEYAVLIREGVDLALAEYEAAGGPELEILERDDGGSPLQAARAISDLESEGAVAVIGPLLSDALEAAGASRRNADLVLLSPTASEAPVDAAHAYSLNATDSQGGAALARWALASGMTRLAVLYATSEAESASAAAFTEAARANGANVVAEVPFDPGTTTFEAPVTRLVESQPQAVMVAASARDLRQLVPQLPFYGLLDVQILGSGAWIEPDVLRSLPRASTEGVVAATPLPTGSGDTGWSDFVTLYEASYRRTLDNPYPALGYDAARLVLREVARGRTDAAAVAEAIAGLNGYRGATGVLSIENGRISRRPFLVRIRAGQPEPLPIGGTPE